jgi:hypothetical protein
VLVTLLFENYLHGNEGIRNRISTIPENRLVTKWLCEKKRLLCEKQDPYTQEDLIWTCVLSHCAENMTQYQVTNLMNIKKAWVSDTAYKCLIASYRKWVSPKEVHFEVPTIRVSMGTFGEDNHQVQLSGRVDIIDHDRKRLFEVKYTDSETADSSHILQLLCYWYLLCMQDEKYKEYELYLMNFRNGQLFRVTPNNDMQQLLKFVIERRHVQPLRLSDEDFQELYFPVTDEPLSDEPLSDEPLALETINFNDTQN